MKTILKIATLFFFLNLYSQEKLAMNSNQIKLDSVVNALKKQEVLYWDRKNGGNTFVNDSLYINLKNISNEKQILEFIKTDNGILKMYSFRVLCNKYKDKCFDIIIDNLRNNTKFKNKSRNGCVLGYDYVTDFWIYYVTSDGWKSEFKLNEKQKNVIDSILISDKSIKLYSRFDALKRIKVNDENYYLIKSLVIKEKNGIALGLLAEYKKPQDIKLIASFFNKKGYQSSFLSAVEKFPDTSLYKFILKIIDIQKKKNEYDSFNEWSNIFIALTKYPSQETNNLFVKMLEEETDIHKKEIFSKSIYLAISKNPNPIFEQIKGKINLSDDDIEDIKMQLESGYFD